MIDIIKKLNEATKAYDEGKPILNDKEWDDLYFKLVEMEKTSGIIYPNSPTQTIVYDAVNALEKIEHNHKMLSLEKTKDINEIISFIGRNNYVAMCKMDGLTCSLTYKEGSLIAAETRGNGLIGENILHNVLVIPSIPKQIPVKEEIVIDGEIICTFEDFKEFSSEYKNPRNFAAGSIRLLDAKECSKRKLTFVAWEVIKGFEEEETFFWKLNNLKDYGFTVVPNIGIITAQLENSPTVNMQTITDLQDEAKKLGYPIDGIVFKFDNIAYGKSLGETIHHFRNAMAYKFYDETYTTNIIDIEWTMGRTGTLTPVAVFEPVEIDGTTVERASMHNLSIVYELFDGMPHYKQEIEVYKSNMIIPQIYSADKTSHGVLYYYDYPIFKIPEVCPICGQETKVKKDYDTEVLICTNSDCEGKFINKLDHYCGKSGLDIRGLSKATLEKLINWNWVNSISDIYTLKEHRDEWIKKPGFGVKSVDNILNAIEVSKSCDLSSFICAMGVPLIGRTVSKDLVKHFPQYQDFRDAIKNNYKFYLLDNFGSMMHYAITQFNYSEFDNIAEKYLQFNTVVVNSNSNKTLEGVNIVITGKLKLYKNRAELQEKIESCGGKVIGSVSKNTNYLINNDTDSASAKNISAKKLGVTIISEEDFVKKFFDF